MNLDEFRGQLEIEKSWRLDELRLLKNQLSLIGADEDKDVFRRSLIVMLYAHFEGFVKSALGVYVSFLNAEGIAYGQAIHSLVAASSFELLACLTSNDRKHPFFRLKAPDDPKLHQMHRQVEFLASLPNFETIHLSIPVDKVIDTESNLKPDVIRKILFRLGFPHEMFDPQLGVVNRLVNIRNGIAHGERRSGVSLQEFDEVEAAVYRIFEDIIISLFDWVRLRRYLRPIE